MGNLGWSRLNCWQERDNFIRREFFLIVFQSRNRDLGLPGVSTMDGLAVVAERHLRKPFWIAAGLGTLGPGVTIAVQADAFDAETITSLSELGGTIAFADGSQVREKRSHAR